MRKIGYVQKNLLIGKHYMPHWNRKKKFSPNNYVVKRNEFHEIYFSFFQILLRARFLEEENARLREEARMINEEKASLKTTIENLNDKIRQIVTTRRSSPEISISGSSGSNSTSTFEAVTIRPLPPT